MPLTLSRQDAIDLFFGEQVISNFLDLLDDSHWTIPAIALKAFGEWSKVPSPDPQTEPDWYEQTQATNLVFGKALLDAIHDNQPKHLPLEISEPFHDWVESTENLMRLEGMN
jgi:hypothetical protein